jgi:hypothetical protein
MKTPSHSSTRILATLALMLGIVFLQIPTTILLAQTTTATNISTQASTRIPREQYAIVPLNVGFVPPISVGNIIQASTGKRIISNVSLHLLGGVGNAVEGVDLSGIWNVQTDYVRGVQGAGIINIVSGDAGYAQGAGVGNIVSGRFEGGQGAGIFNIASGGISGAQGAGIFNATENADAVQAAGIFNSAKNLRGVQAAGVFNQAADVVGVQAAGVFNVAKNVEGLQTAGVINIAKHVRGAQIGLINIAEDNEDVMIGLFNFNAKTGIRLEMSFDELRFIRAALRSGNRAWYSEITGGVQPFNGITLWSIGYGAGTQLYLGTSDYIDVSLHAEGIYSGIRNLVNNGAFNPTSVGRLRVLFGHEFAPHFAVFFGSTLNVMSGYGAENTLYELVPTIFSGNRFLFEPNNINNSSSNPAWLRSWIGFTGGFRF